MATRALIYAAAWALAAPAGAAEPPAMTFQLVRMADPACDPDCPRWIAAQGAIKPGAARAFKAFLAGLDGRRYPLLIASGGGSVEDAMEIGRTLRARGLAVAVARTLVTGASQGVAVTAPAYCMSACTLILAAGVERYVIPAAAVGVHEVKQTLTRTLVHRQFLVHYRIVDGRKQEVSRDLVSETRSASTSTQVSPPQMNARIAAYLAEMGVGHEVLDLMLTATPDQIHRLTAAELADSHLATAWMLNVSAFARDGLDAAPVDPSRGDHAQLSAKTPVALAGGGFTLALSLRRGGGGVAATARFEGAAPREAVWTPAPPQPLRVESHGDGRIATSFLPGPLFCRYARLGALELRDPAPPTQAPALPDPRGAVAVVTLARMEGAAALADELCGKGRS